MLIWMSGGSLIWPKTRRAARQTYNRGGVLYGSYDEMFISLLPRKVENPELKRILRDYFRIRSEKVKVEESITVYKDATERFGD